MKAATDACACADVRVCVRCAMTRHDTTRHALSVPCVCVSRLCGVLLVGAALSPDTAMRDTLPYNMTWHMDNGQRNVCVYDDGTDAYVRHVMSCHVMSYMIHVAVMAAPDAGGGTAPRSPSSASTSISSSPTHPHTRTVRAMTNIHAYSPLARTSSLQTASHRAARIAQTIPQTQTHETPHDVMQLLATMEAQLAAAETASASTRTRPRSASESSPPHRRNSNSNSNTAQTQHIRQSSMDLHAIQQRLASASPTHEDTAYHETRHTTPTRTSSRTPQPQASPTRASHASSPTHTLYQDPLMSTVALSRQQTAPSRQHRAVSHINVSHGRPTSYVPSRPYGAVLFSSSPDRDTIPMHDMRVSSSPLTQQRHIQQQEHEERIRQAESDTIPIFVDGLSLDRSVSLPVMSRTCHTHVTHVTDMACICRTHATQMSYTWHVHMSYTHTHMSYTPIHAFHTSHTCHAYVP